MIRNIFFSLFFFSKKISREISTTYVENNLFLKKKKHDEENSLIKSRQITIDFVLRTNCAVRHDWRRFSIKQNTIFPFCLRQSDRKEKPKHTRQKKHRFLIPPAPRSHSLSPKHMFYPFSQTIYRFLFLFFLRINSIIKSIAQLILSWTQNHTILEYYVICVCIRCHTPPTKFHLKILQK